MTRPHHLRCFIADGLRSLARERRDPRRHLADRLLRRLQDVEALLGAGWTLPEVVGASFDDDGLQAAGVLVTIAAFEIMNGTRLHIVGIDANEVTVVDTAGRYRVIRRDDLCAHDLRLLWEAAVPHSHPAASGAQAPPSFGPCTTDRMENRP